MRKEDWQLSKPGDFILMMLPEILAVLGMG
jgi:hypothetical protein